MKYVVVLTADVKSLVAYCNKRLQQGWKPLGGVSITAHAFCQAFVREEPTAKEVEQAAWELWTERVKALLVDEGIPLKEPDGSVTYQKQMRALLKIYQKGQAPEIAVSELLRVRWLVEIAGVLVKKEVKDVEQSWAYDNIEIYARRIECEEGTGRKKVFYATTTLTEYDFEDPDATVGLPPTLVLSEEAAQVLLDNLWDCGLRPSEAQYEKGALVEAKEHIASLKEVVRPLLDTVAVIATKPEHSCVRVEKGEIEFVPTLTRAREDKIRGLLSREEIREIKKKEG